MKRALIAAAVVVGMTIATSSAMAQGRYYGGPRGFNTAPIGVQVARRSYAQPYGNFRSGYYRSSNAYRGRGYYRSPNVYRSRSYYRSPGIYGGRSYYNRGGYGFPTRGFSLGIGF